MLFLATSWSVFSIASTAPCLFWQLGMVEKAACGALGLIWANVVLNWAATINHTEVWILLHWQIHGNVSCSGVSERTVCNAVMVIRMVVLALRLLLSTYFRVVLGRTWLFTFSRCTLASSFCSLLCTALVAATIQMFVMASLIRHTFSCMVRGSLADSTWLMWAYS